MHPTNYTLNRKSERFVQGPTRLTAGSKAGMNEGSFEHATKRPLSVFLSQLIRGMTFLRPLWETIRRAVVNTLALCVLDHFCAQEYVSTAARGGPLSKIYFPHSWRGRSFGRHAAAMVDKKEHELEHAAVCSGHSHLRSAVDIDVKRRCSSVLRIVEDERCREPETVTDHTGLCESLQ